MSSLENVRPARGTRPRFISQNLKIDVNDPERNQPLSKGRMLIGNPSESPVGLALDTGNGVHGVEVVLALGGVLDVSIDKERVSLGMDILQVHHNLEAIETVSLSGLDPVREPFRRKQAHKRLG